MLSEECPIFAPEREAYLHRILFTLIKRWHTLINPSPERLQQIIPTHVWSIYGEYLRQSHKLAINSIQKLVDHSGCGTCDPEKIAEFYNLQTILLVENANTDGAWVELVARKLRPNLAGKFGGPYPVLSIRQAGGIGEVPKELRRIAATYNAVKPTGSVPLRIVVLVDSDAKAPGCLSRDASSVVSTANEVGATVHVLQKRTIENYIPNQSLSRYAAKRQNHLAAEDVARLDWGPAGWRGGRKPR